MSARATKSAFPLINGNLRYLLRDTDSFYVIGDANKSMVAKLRCLILLKYRIVTKKVSLMS